MRKILICRVDPETSSRLKREMDNYGWAVDSCEGMLEMLRLIEKNEYDMIILNASDRNVEVHTRLGAIKALEKNPRIVLNLPDSEKSFPALLFMADYQTIKGALTSEKLLVAVSQRPDSMCKAVLKERLAAQEPMQYGVNQGGPHEHETR